VPDASPPSDDAYIRREDQDPRHWKANGWSARVIKNDDDDGWAVEMTRDGDPEPALVGPWTMGRDKKTPKPLDANAFATLVKTATEVLQRHEQQRRAMLHKQVEVVGADGARVRVELDIVPDEDDPHAVLSAFDGSGGLLGRARVLPNFKLTPATAARWVANDFREP
jgi:hypothetical protein